ncbi:hypothetical protein N7474_004546 [Penicillium riverlandense]|uniref:uncharacterized protein n=1 Tax=Penicillium riverlandense TaxID=1903569 RepID=UPI0025488C28|nr:uncharacterized protein N7474_004546 [Penicillium riverlandense]KAJ5818955.1 hypothetical protein N7474_004546 [Penicillium riverlandense]
MDDSHGKAISTVTAIFLAVSAVSVCLRCFVRLHIVRSFGWDDITMLLAMAFNLAFAVCGIVGCQYGMGRELAYFIVYPEDFPRAMLCWWLGQIFYVITCVAAKVSIIITLLRITIDRIHAWILYGAIALASAVGLVFLFFTIFECQPIDFFWNRTSEQGTCIDPDVLLAIAYLYSVGAAITDLTIGLLPVAFIWNLRMSRRNKQAIIGILGIGCIASAAVIIRIPFISHYKDKQFLYNTYQISIWSNIEAGLGITAGCLTTLRPLIRFFREGSSTSQSPNRNAGTYPLSNNMPSGVVRPSRSKQDDPNQTHHLWDLSENDDYQGVTTTIMGSRDPKLISSSEEDLNPSYEGWKVERSVHVSVQDAD